jgi:hypothetical protein
LELGLFQALRIGDRILNAVADRASLAAARSRFAALPARFLKDIGMTKAERAATLGCEEPTTDGSASSRLTSERGLPINGKSAANGRPGA